jgi:hypothetical protein
MRLRLRDGIIIRLWLGSGKEKIRQIWLQLLTFLSRIVQNSKIATFSCGSATLRTTNKMNDIKFKLKNVIKLVMCFKKSAPKLQILEN